MIAERTDGFWKGALAEGKTYCLRTATNDYFFTPAEYKKLAIDMLQLVDHYRGNLLKRIKAADREIYKQCRKGNR